MKPICVFVIKTTSEQAEFSNNTMFLHLAGCLNIFPLG